MSLEEKKSSNSIKKDLSVNNSLSTDKIAEDVNILGAFCGKRDLNTLTQTELKDKYGITQADVMVLFGGSIICGGDILAEAILNKVSKKYVIVGGSGHTTEALRMKINALFPEMKTSNLPEAELFQCYLKIKYNLRADFLECKSTNCGNNISCLLDLLHENKIECKTIIISQDATMQRRMEACLRKSSDMTIISYATYRATVVNDNGVLKFSDDILGMWSIDRYINLLMGDIARMNDDENGYGPKGKNFISHVDIPDEVMNAYLELKQISGYKVREANPLYANIK